MGEPLTREATPGVRQACGQPISSQKADLKKLLEAHFNQRITCWDLLREEGDGSKFVWFRLGTGIHLSRPKMARVDPLGHIHLYQLIKVESLQPTPTGVKAQPHL